MTYNKIFKSILLLAFFNILIKFSGFGRELLVAFFYGTNNIIDNFNILMLSPNIMLNIAGPALGIILITQIIEKNNNTNFDEKNIRVVIPVLLIKFSIVISVLIISLSLATYFFIEDLKFFHLLIVIFLSFVYFFQVLLVYFFQSLNRFVIGTTSSLLQVIVSILLLLYSLKMKSLEVLLVSLTVGVLIQIFVIIYYSQRNEFKIQLYIDMQNNPTIKYVLFSSIITIGLMELFISITKLTAYISSIDGLVSAVNYSYKVINLPISIFMVSVLTVLFPQFGKLEKSGKIKELLDFGQEVIKNILLLILPISVFMYINSGILLKVLFERGEFDYKSLIVTQEVFSGIVLIIPLIAVNSILFRIQIVKKSYNHLIITSMLAIVLLVILQLITIHRENVLLFSSSILIVLFLLLVEQIRSVKYKISVKFILKLLFSLLISSLLNYKIITLLKYDSEIIILITSFFVQIIVYFLVLLLLKESTMIKIYKRMLS